MLRGILWGADEFGTGHPKSRIRILQGGTNFVSDDIVPTKQQNSALKDQRTCRKDES